MCQYNHRQNNYIIIGIIILWLIKDILHPCFAHNIILNIWAQVSYKCLSEEQGNETFYPLFVHGIATKCVHMLGRKACVLASNKENEKRLRLIYQALPTLKFCHLEPSTYLKELVVSKWRLDFSIVSKCVRINKIV